MIVTLDGQQYSTSLPPTATLQNLVDELRPRLGGRLIVSLTVDGRELVGDELGQLLNRPLAGVGQVELTSADRWQLAADVLREVGQQLGRVGSRQQEVAQELRAGNVGAALGRFGEALEAWQVCQTAVAQCSGLLERDLTVAECAGRPLREHLAELADRLRELRGACEARDVVWLGDLLTYEMPELCQRWQALLGELAGQLAARPADDGSR